VKDLSLHILDVVENSIRAEARRIGILVEVDEATDLLRLEITDDGVGMEEAMCRRATDPFVTTKDGKCVGLGLPLLAQAAREAGGRLELSSSPGRGTRVVATFRYSHPDRKPLGDIAATIQALVTGHPGIDLRYEQRIDDRIDIFDTREVGCR
jgi:signal transduction histidine kinase